MTLRVVSPGSHAILVDKGRFGAASRGIAAGGPADPLACFWANRLVENAEIKTTAEILLGGAQFKATKRCTVAVAGASVDLEVDGQSVHMWQGMTLEAGQTLSMGMATQGIRIYLAVHGGFSVQPVLGSTSAVTREQLGGLTGKGDPLHSGDKLPLHDECTKSGWALPPEHRPSYSDHMTLALIPGYQYHDFSRASLTRLFSHTYQVKADSNRMGIRLKGAEVKSDVPLTYSEGLALGAVQCPPDGQPIIMLSDRQTIGGYPKPGVISTLDCGRLGQIKPGDTLSFCVSDALTERKRWLLNQAKLSRVKLIRADA